MTYDIAAQRVGARVNDLNDWNLLNDLNPSEDGRPFMQETAVATDGIFQTEFRQHVPQHRRITGDDGQFQLGLDPFETLDRIKHRALKINCIDFAGRSEAVLGQLENLSRCHALGHRELGE